MAKCEKDIGKKKRKEALPNSVKYRKVHKLKYMLCKSYASNCEQHATHLY